MASAAIDLTAACRGLHLVDLENLIGDPWARGPCVGRALDQYLERAGFRAGDLVFVAGNPWLMVELGWSQLDCRAPPVGSRRLPPVRGTRSAGRRQQAARGRAARVGGAPVRSPGRRQRRRRVRRSARAARASGLSVQVVSRRESLSQRVARLGLPIEWFVDDSPAPLQLVSRRRTSARRPIESSTSRWSSARWRTITSVAPISPSALKPSATVSTLPHTGAAGSKPR